MPESYDGLPRLLFDPEVERALAAFDLQTDAQWARLEHEEDAILQIADPALRREVDMLERMFVDALEDDRSEEGSGGPVIKPKSSFQRIRKRLRI